MQHSKPICSLFNENIYCRVKRSVETRRSGQLIKPSVLLEVHRFVYPVIKFNDVGIRLIC